MVFKEKKSIELKEQKELQLKLINLKENYVHVDEKYKDLKQKQDEKTKDLLNKKETTIMSKKLTRNNINHFSEFDELTLDITNDKLNKNERKLFKKLPTVKSYEVKTIGGSK